MTIKTWPADDRPREKLINKGAVALSDAELLALLFGTGMRGKSAVDLARDLLGSFKSLRSLFGAPFAEFSRIPGIGMAKYAQLQAVTEIARRALSEQMHSGSVLSSPKAVRDYLRLTLQPLQQERFFGLFLDAQNKVISADELSRGTLTQTSVYPREIVKRALAHNAASVIFAHNHPSGSTDPSQADHNLTRILVNALSTVDVKVLDHFIVAPGSILAFSERGYMP